MNFPAQFCLGSISEKVYYVQSDEVSFQENVYDFSFSYEALDISEIFDVHNYLMVKNTIK